MLHQVGVSFEFFRYHYLTYVGRSTLLTKLPFTLDSKVIYSLRAQPYRSEDLIRLIPGSSNSKSVAIPNELPSPRTDEYVVENREGKKEAKSVLS